MSSRYGIVGMRAPVCWFANEMERQLQENDHKTGWEFMTETQLLNRMKQEIAELETALKSKRNVVEEAADVANFAMMIADNFEASR